MFVVCCLFVLLWIKYKLYRWTIVLLVWRCILAVLQQLMPMSNKRVYSKLALLKGKQSKGIAKLMGNWKRTPPPHWQTSRWLEPGGKWVPGTQVGGMSKDRVPLLADTVPKCYITGKAERSPVSPSYLPSSLTLSPPFLCPSFLPSFLPIPLFLLPLQCLPLPLEQWSCLLEDFFLREGNVWGRGGRCDCNIAIP